MLESISRSSHANPTLAETLKGKKRNYVDAQFAKAIGKWMEAGWGEIRKKKRSVRERENGCVFEQRPLCARTGFQYISPPPISDVFVNNEY